MASRELRERPTAPDLTMRVSVRYASLCALSVPLLVACGAAPANGHDPARVAPAGAPAPDRPARASADPEAYAAGVSASDVVAPYVRPERSSRLGVPLPRGRARERWTAPLEPNVD